MDANNFVNGNDLSSMNVKTLNILAAKLNGFKVPEKPGLMV